MPTFLALVHTQQTASKHPPSKKSKVDGMEGSLENGSSQRQTTKPAEPTAGQLGKRDLDKLSVKPKGDSCTARVVWGKRVALKE